MEKVRGLTGSYPDPPDTALVLCVDGRLQIPALNRSAPILPMVTPALHPEPLQPARTGARFFAEVTRPMVQRGSSTLVAYLERALRLQTWADGGNDNSRPLVRTKSSQGAFETIAAYLHLFNESTAQNTKDGGASGCWAVPARAVPRPVFHHGGEPPGRWPARGSVPTPPWPVRPRCGRGQRGSTTSPGPR